MNVDFNDESMEGIFAFLDDESIQLDEHIDEHIFTRDILSTRPINNVLVSDDNESVSKVHEEVKSIHVKKRVVTKSYNRTKLPFMHRLYKYCQDEKNKEWIDFYSKGGVHIKNITKLSEDCLISPLLNIKFASFRKMLINYGFQSIRERSSVDEVIYQNPQFVKESYEQCLNIITTPEKIRSIDNPRKKGVKRRKSYMSDTSSETSDETWVPPPKNKRNSSTKTSLEESIPYLASGVIKKIKNIEEDFHSSSITRSEVRKYQQKLMIIHKVLHES